MNATPDAYQERLLCCFDQLSILGVFHRSSWPAITAALKTIGYLLSQVSLGTADTVDFAEISCPDPSSPLYSWFSGLQETFHGNIAVQLFHFLSRLDSVEIEKAPADEIAQITRWITLSLYLLQGCLLLHEPSRTLLSRSPHMSLLCGFLDGRHHETVHMDTIQTLVSGLVDRPDNFRIFEKAGGLEKISVLFKDTHTAHQVKVKILEFLYFYLMPEHSSSRPERVSLGAEKPDGSTTVARTRRDTNSGGSAIPLQHHLSERSGKDDHYSSNESQGKALAHNTRQALSKSTSEKQMMLGRYFSNIDALVQDLNEFKPFGDF